MNALEIVGSAPIAVLAKSSTALFASSTNCLSWSVLTPMSRAASLNASSLRLAAPMDWASRRNCRSVGSALNRIDVMSSATFEDSSRSASIAPAVSSSESTSGWYTSFVRFCASRFRSIQGCSSLSAS